MNVRFIFFPNFKIICRRGIVTSYFKKIWKKCFGGVLKNSVQVTTSYASTRSIYTIFRRKWKIISLLVKYWNVNLIKLINFLKRRLIKHLFSLIKLWKFSYHGNITAMIRETVMNRMHLIFLNFFPSWSSVREKLVENIYTVE